MSVKRQATTDLNHDNWDQDDSNEQEEMGAFKTAAKDVLEKRVIRTAKRRSQISSDEPKKSVFSGFGGFNKVQPSSFDFLSNLTNGSKANNGQQSTKVDTAVSSSVFSSKPATSSPGTGIFSMSGTPGFAAKSTFGKPSEGSVFGNTTASNTSPMHSVFTATKADSTVNDSPFKMQATPSATINTDSAAKIQASPDVSTSQVSSTIFGVPSKSSTGTTLFTTTTNNSPLFATQPVSSTSTQSYTNTTTTITTTTKTDSNTAETSTESEKERKRMRYYSKLKGLNESVTEWIRKHVEESALCILSPIFKDYEKYLKQIQDEYEGRDNKEKIIKEEVKSEVKVKVEKTEDSSTKNTPGANNSSSSVFGNIATTTTTPLKAQSSLNILGGMGTKPSFNFGINTPASTTVKPGFSFGMSTSTPSTASSLFSVNTTTTPNVGSPFSFGISNTGFGFNSNAQTNTETPAQANEEDEPPKVEFTPVVEDNSVYDKRCKIFFKKDGSFVDKGVGTLYIKKIEESGKHQLLVRANTNLGNVLLNFVLSSSIPTQRMGKNNVMLVCIPTPDAKPPPTPILIRVKGSEEADELLDTLNKYKA